MLSRILRLIASTMMIVIVVANAGDPVSAKSRENSEVDFSGDVRPILSDHCFACHGPDAEERAADLRLDTEQGLASVVNTNDVAASDLIKRIGSDDADEVMPPTDFHKPLSQQQKVVLRRWVEAGGQFQKHWAFVPADRDRTSTSESVEQTASAVDEFLSQEIARHGLTANPAADRRSQLRRVCLDLTGLPPTRQQLKEFLSDDSGKAYENLVDQLLRSPQFGQHVGRHWLDLVRYADTHGLHLDNYREMWLYRDWVIEALNANMPFDQFIIRQLAGDLLPDATEADRIASGFNRLNVTTNEGGSIYEEVFARNCMDRTDAFGTIFLGLTTGCAVCHDHKFDPIAQRDYYSLLAFFNSLDGTALDQNRKDPPPFMEVPSQEQKDIRDDLEQSLADLRNEMRDPIESVDLAQSVWERSLMGDNNPIRHVLEPTEVQSQTTVKMIVDDDGWIVVDGIAAAKDITTVLAPLPPGVQWQTLHLEAGVDDPEARVGASDNGNVVLSEITIEVTDDGLDGQWVPVPIKSAFADIEQGPAGFTISNAVDGKVDAETGWAVNGHQQKGGRRAWFVVPSLIAEGENAKVRIQLKYQSKFAQHQFRKVRISLSDGEPNIPIEQQIVVGPVHLAGPFPVESPTPGYSRSFASQQKPFKDDEIFTYQDKPFHWEEREDWSEVVAHDVPNVQDQASVMVIHQSLTAPKAQSITILLGIDDGYMIFLNEKQIAKVNQAEKRYPLSQDYRLPLRKGHNDLYIKLINHQSKSEMTYAFQSSAIPVPDQIRELVQVSLTKRDTKTDASLRQYFRRVHCLHPDWSTLVSLEKGTLKAKKKLQAEIPTTLVWKETKEPRPAHVLIRGQYDQPGDVVPRDTPSFLPPLPSDAPKNRLGLAKWLTSPDHPLTSRVAVNRFWQQLFGSGLVKTSEDFGSQGEPPSHPELLDFLAVDFQKHGWDVKRLIKSLVLTDGYRRDATVNDSMQRIDPKNRLLARGPRYRLDAEVLRDQALSLAGRLIDDAGGPSVKPPQPDGLWKAVGYSGSNTVKFTADKGDKVNRRSVYVFWKRTSPPPQMSTLDAPSRESCTARRERTNTPLQALLLMNDQQYLEASRSLAKRAIESTVDADSSERMSWLFETVTARLPSEQEKFELMGLLNDMAVYYDANPELAARLTDESSGAQAAWTVVASTLLNLDEVVNK